MTPENQKSNDQVILSGLDGSNPLGFLAALGAMAAFHKAGQITVKLAWQRTVKWTPVLKGVSTTEPEALSQLLAEALRGNVVSEGADVKRETAQSEFDKAKKAVKEKRDEIKKRRLRRNSRQEAIETEVKPLEEILRQKRRTWLASLKDAVPRPELAIGRQIDCMASEFREHAYNFIEDSNFSSREVLDLMADFGSDACIQKTSERIEATSFCFITGSGHQYFLDTIRQLVSEVQTGRIQSALFNPWTYKDEKLSMRWDPLEDRRYALMDRDPTASDNKSRTVWMANLLAYQALVLFSSAPTKKGLATTGWIKVGEDNTFTWPVWETFVGVDVIRSILQSPELSEKDLDSSAIRERGLAAVFRARRIQVGNPPLHKINFSPAKSV